MKVGAEVGDSSTNDVILVRGASADVDKAVQEIFKIVEEAKDDEIANSHVSFRGHSHRKLGLTVAPKFIEFDIDREFVGRIVGAHGAGVNRLREQFGVKFDIFDDIEDKDGKKKKGVHQKSKIKVSLLKGLQKLNC